MNFSSKRLSQTITQLCLAKEIDHIVISPGSRNAPLIIGFTEHSEFKNFSIVDERCAAFFALGMAQQLNRPVALVCTSGSALLNYYPAIAEAFYSDIPLVVISADRPANLIDIGDGQTIRQEHVFANHILFNANCVEGDEFQIRNETIINAALNTAIEINGPVHINVPFSEPLYDKVEDLTVRPQQVPARITANELPENFPQFQKEWKSAKRLLVLIGVMKPNSIEQQFLDRLANDGRIVVLTETTSNLHHKDFFPAIDQLISALDDDGFKELQPDLLVTFGGMVVSKRIKAFIRKYRPSKHWHIDPKKAFDTYFSLTSHIKTSPNFFLNKILSEENNYEAVYRDRWLKVKAHRLEQHSKYLGQAPFSDLKAYGTVFGSIPGHMQLQIANSAAIRYAQLFDLPEGLEVFCNRGTSGIDGSNSTALGAAVIVSRQTVLVTGDLSFFYDSNALWNSYIPANFRIIVINNSGGGIFRILPGAKAQSHFEEYFETSHELTAENLCKMYGLEYVSAHDEQRLKDQLSYFYTESGSARLLEVFTPSALNDKVLRDYFEFIR